MLETLTILPTAPGTRTRRADVLHRATPVFLPSNKPKQPLQQPALEQQHQQHHHHNHRLARLSPLQPPPAFPLHQLGPLPQQQQQQRQQQQLPFSISTHTRSIQNILNHANSMRPKRKIDKYKEADNDSDNNDDNVSCKVAFRKRPKLAVEIYTKPLAGSQSVPRATLPADTAPKQALPTLPAAAIAPSAAPSSSLSAAGTARAGFAPFTTNTALASSTITKTPSGRASSSSASSRAAVSKSRSVKYNDGEFANATTAPPSSAAATFRSNHYRTVDRPPLKTATQLAANPGDKAVNGIKQELKSLQVTPADAVAVASGPLEGGRKLRSQEATRFKSELSAYFPDYDEVIGNEPRREHLLNLDTPILLIESASPQLADKTGTPLFKPSLNESLSSTIQAAPALPVRGYGDKLFYDVFDSHVLDFTFLGSQQKGKDAVDPLPDSFFAPHHKRAERLERSIRNSEKGRAQHEKDQIIRLLEGLLGHDWLRTMGVSGITESKKKSFEPAREHFIRGCRVILEKFRLWGLEEKRRKQEKDRAHAEEAKARNAAGVAGRRERRGREKAKALPAVVRADSRLTKQKAYRDQAHDGAGEPQSRIDTTNGDSLEEDEDASGDDSTSQPDSSDVDAVIARQLRDEALARSRVAAAKLKAVSKRRKVRQSSSPVSNRQIQAPVEPWKPPKKEVRSFFRKRYQREAALSRSRRKGRTIMAWGQPVPELSQTDFDLPDDILNGGATKLNGHRRERVVHRRRI
ncbi:hypothetical protein SPI_03913 [Niveomyces insectorum RCEF 264]|uniref:Something about silencing protein 4 domain-containing protein n=1 Tax=Niveomyces insectorum RCEF 264 TaxID=1081102 RepID=A0A162MLG9_9HYPO|nr:hypothetical protein SPI_03913 [Niveomyces insectorum RCEF 264]